MSRKMHPLRSAKPTPTAARVEYNYWDLPVPWMIDSPEKPSDWGKGIFNWGGGVFGVPKYSGATSVRRSNHKLRHAA